MSEEIAAIDTTPIDALLLIQQKQDQLQQLVERAEASRGKVSQAVFRRVSEDYEARRRALDAEARPLRKKARQEHARLEPLHERLRHQVDDARLDREELEFRHSVGELPEEEFAQRSKAAEDLLVARQREFAEADELKQRLVAVMGPGEPEPVAAPPAVAPPARPAAPVSEPPPPTHPLEEVLDDSTATLARPPAADAAQAETDGGSEQTAWIPPDALGEAGLVVDQPEPERGGEGTMVMRFARLVAEEADPPEEFQLGMRTTIGRTPDNDVTIANGLVSRHHAVVTFSNDGYLLADLKSGNGTSVNDQRIEQHVLAEGDRVKIGPMLFVFHAAEE